MTVENLTVDVRLSRTQGGDGSRPNRLTITDQASGINFVEVRLTDDELGKIVGGTGLVDLDGKGPWGALYGPQFVGKVHQHQSKHFGSQDEADAWGAAMKADGWDTYSSSRTNQPSVLAIVRRYVDADKAATS